MIQKPRAMDSAAWSVCIAVLLTALAPAIAQPVCEDGEAVPGHIILKLESEGAGIDAVVQQYGLTLLNGFPEWNLYSVLAGAPGQAALQEMIDTMDGDADIDEAKLHRVSETPEGVQLSIPDIDLAITPDDYENQTAGTVVNKDAALTRYTGAGVVIAVVDTGMAFDHPVTRDGIQGAGVDFAEGDGTAGAQGNSADDDGDGLVDESLHHATFVTGLIHLIAPDARILPIRTLDAEGKGRSFSLAKGIMYAVENGADVINLSEITQRESRAIEEALESAADAGVVVVAATGNDGEINIDAGLEDGCGSFVASRPETIAVAAVDTGLVRSYFSNYGPHVDLSAPGRDLLSTYGEAGFAGWEGTSFAAPFVTGAVALVLEKYPGLTPAEVRGLLTATARPDNNPPELDGLMGAGVLDLDALTLALADDRTSLEVHPTLQGTVVSWSPVLGAAVYDVARGNLAGLSESAIDEDQIDLGPLTCIANDLADLDTSALADPLVPAPGEGFFYVFRDDATVAADGRSFGESSAGKTRVAGPSDCPIGP